MHGIVLLLLFNCHAHCHAQRSHVTSPLPFAHFWHFVHFVKSVPNPSLRSPETPILSRYPPRIHRVNMNAIGFRVFLRLLRRYEQRKQVFYSYFTFTILIDKINLQPSRNYSTVQDHKVCNSLFSLVAMKVIP